MAVITISKEFGTESDKVASQAAQRLGYEYIGDHLIAEIAKELHVSESEAEMFRKTSQSRILRFVDRYTCSLVQKVVDREHGCLDDKNYYKTTKKLVQNVYEAGNAIILGWGGQCLLRGKPNTLHVRLIKDEETKIKEVMQNRNLEHKAAKSFIEREEGDLKAYIEHYFNEDWNAAHLYDLIIDMGKTSVEKAVDLICDNLKHKA
ncbi:MAG: cytidylate kinase-like family protein [Deltaproteobacteria bacterium]|nr:cytidylate kinase-like family protein [Deltaproteobacteria bacterium]MBW1959740.1 cytidylate kinase-like family protein [Deltaproteobacteria bacterium]MBW2015162.1 cytidylate kinase-like family protein [Deltaproteobacteria bacterium]MBW2321809.1 cytidylate kinase-like family protein [Deltaproteobacteria bacterium]